MISVCYVVDAPVVGGAELYVSRLAGALDARRFRPSVLMRDAGDPRLARWADDLRERGIHVTSLPMHLPFAPRHAFDIWRFLERRAPHVVHVNLPGPYDGQMGLILPVAKAAGACTVVTEHLPMVPVLWKRAAVKRAAYRFLDVAVTMTHANARYLVERQGVPAPRVRVVANGIREDYGVARATGVEQRWALGIRDSRVVIVYVGHILPHKGLRRLIDAMARARTREQLHLLVVGSGPDEAASRQLAADRGLSAQVSFLGWCDAARTETVLAAGDVLALPSEIEGLPYVLLEAMASGLPVIAGRVYGVPEVVGDGVTGLLVDPGNVDEIAVALDTLAADPELRARMGSQGRQRFERDFTLAHQARAMEAIYRSLLGRATP
ncbi:MAG TPA: glycosyltransferase family 4 protein [Candidatus Krumholzibacteria bacterium]|nr:glycosyltransferase family 4 protein [Candidatus Krumholzibacteria bacterium]